MLHPILINNVYFFTLVMCVTMMVFNICVNDAEVYFSVFQKSSLVHHMAFSSKPAYGGVFVFVIKVQYVDASNSKHFCINTINI